MSVLPKFDFSGMTVKDEELDEALKDTAVRTERFFKPGKHEVQVVRSEYKGVASDETWGKVVVEYEGAGGQLITDLILIPFKDITSFKGKDGKNQTLPARRLKNLLEALGVQVTISTLGETLKQYFGKDNGLKGMNVAIETGFKGPHAKYMGKTPDGTIQIAIVSRKGEQLAGTPMFTDYAQAKEYATNNNIELSRFVDVLGYLPSSTPNKQRPKADW